MSTRDDSQKLLEKAWEATSSKVALSDSLAQEFFSDDGSNWLSFGSRRSYQRSLMRGKALLVRGESTIGAYTKDISRKGIGFLAPIALQPNERVKLLLATAELTVEVVRCHQIEPACFECGARFIVAETTFGEMNHRFSGYA